MNDLRPDRKWMKFSKRQKVAVLGFVALVILAFLIWVIVNPPWPHWHKICQLRLEENKTSQSFYVPSSRWKITCIAFPISDRGDISLLIYRGDRSDLILTRWIRVSSEPDSSSFILHEGPGGFYIRIELDNIKTAEIIIESYF